MAAAFDDTISNSLQCRLCSDLLSDPQQLPCTHTFCRKCLSSPPGCTAKTPAMSPVCPICQIETKVRGVMNLNLNTNIPVKSVVDDVRNGKRLCEICNKRSRQNLIFCSECGKHMCRECLDYNCPHKTVVTVRDIGERKVVPKTKVHCQDERHKPGRLDKICTHVCTRPCKKLICKKCRLLYHTEVNGHTVQDVEEYNTSITAKIESLLSQGKIKVAAIKSHTAFIKSQKKRVTEHIEGEKTKLNKEYEELTNELKDRRVALQQLESLKDESCLKLKQMIDDNEKLVANIEDKCEEANDSLEAALEGDIVAIRDLVCYELKDLLDSNYSDKKLATKVAYRAEQLKFTPGKKYEWSSIGRQTFRFGVCLVFFLFSLVVLEFISSLARSHIDLRCEVEFTEGSMHSMTASPDGMMAVGYNTGGIAFYSADGQLQQTVLKNVRILDVGFLSDGRCVVVNVFYKIMLYTSTWEQLDLWFGSLNYCDNMIRSLAIGSDDQIYISYAKSKKIYVFSPAGGNAIREIQLDGYKPMQVTSIGDDLIVEQYNNVVIIIDKKGNIKHGLIKPGDHYLHAAVSTGNSVFIASVSHEEGLLSIEEYTTELKLMTTLIADFKIEKPKRNWYNIQQFRSGEIAFSTPDRLYIFHQSKSC